MAFRRRYHNNYKKIDDISGMKSQPEQNAMPCGSWSSLVNSREFRNTFNSKNKKVMRSFVAIFAGEAGYLAADTTPDYNKHLITVELIKNIFIGIIASKKIGNAVVRNRAKRRIREAWRVVTRKGGFFYEKKSLCKIIGNNQQAEQVFNRDKIAPEQKDYDCSKKAAVSNSVNVVFIARHNTANIKFKTLLYEIRTTLKTILDCDMA